MGRLGTQTKRSPLREKPLRSPGDSLQEEIDRLENDRLMPVAALAVVGLVLAGLEWWRWLTSSPPQPIVATLIASVLIAHAVHRFVKVRPQLHALQLGRDGERIVGQSLEELRRQGFRVFHDIPGDGFNIDHVVVGPQGVFAIETKTFSKPVKGDAKVLQDGDRILFNGLEPERNPVLQARAIRDWLRDLLFRTTAKRYPVKGVVVFPGWWVEAPSDGKRGDVWVLNPKALPAFIAREPVALSGADIALVSERLANHVTHS